MSLDRDLEEIVRLQEKAERRRQREQRRAPKRELPGCGARTRAGHPCRAPAWRPPELAVPRNGRCRMHGGLSTGPRTPEGKARCLEAARRNLELANAVLQERRAAAAPAAAAELA